MFDINIDGHDQIFLVEDYLDESTGITPSKLLNIISKFDFKNQKVPKIGFYDISDIFQESLNELDFFYKTNMYSEYLCDFLYEKMMFLKKSIDNYDRVLCHGDLSNNNIMRLSKSCDDYVLIDWEDAFWGIKGYDYLYWLTFFDNKKWLSKNNILLSGYEFDVCESLILLILIIKNSIAYYSGKYLFNSVGMEDRILRTIEILEKN